jgi:hypothetical protein
MVAARAFEGAIILIAWSALYFGIKHYGTVVLISRFATVPLLLLGVLGHGQSNPQLTGAIMDQMSTPITGVRVTLSSLDRVLQTRTAADGTFRFQGIPGGTYDLEFYAPGFVKQEFPVHVSNSSPQTFKIVLKIGNLPDMSACGPHPSIQYGAPEVGAGRVTGVVRRYYDQKPVENATASLWRAGEKRPAFRSNSGRTGGFEFNHVPPNHYDLRIRRPGYLPAELKQLLIPRETGLSIDFPVLKEGEMAICE